LVIVPGVRPGVLALQGDFREHVRLLRALGTEPLEVRTPEDLARADRLVIPGGESTTIGKLLLRDGLMEPVRRRAAAGMPVLGTCAGMILMAARVLDGGVDQPGLGVMDISVRRNAFGRQVDSFEAELEMDDTGESVRGVFIRAPQVEAAGPDVRVLARLDGRPVAVQEGSRMALAFHPELIGESRLHRRFLALRPEARTDVRESTVG
jgi:5'-phosphate synthase pdxT subunit